MKRKDNASAWRTMIDFVDGALDFVRPGHKDKDVTVSSVEMLRNGLRRKLPRWIVARLMTQVLDLDGICASLRRQGLARGQMAFQLCAVKRGGHDDDLEVGTQWTPAGPKRERG